LCSRKEETMAIRVRFAPSPTGPLHIGGARSALFNFLLARKMGGQFVVRIEDTDLERSSRESEANILESLRWLGISWDEGIDAGGDHGPYRQTERLSLYREYADRLLAAGQAYYCYCSEDELAQEREALLAREELPRYLGKCRQLTEAKRAELEACGRKPVIRFRVPDNETIVIDDMVRGEVSFESSGIGDFVIVKSDGIPTYNFAVVVDDAQMEITHVVRGEEHLSNTPRQILLYQALRLEPPRFAHVSLILGKDRSKMSKRHGATSIVQYQRLGYLPDALVNFLALLGWAPPGEEEIFDMDELINHFSLDRVAKNPAVFDLDKLNWLNGHYIRHSPTDKIVEMAVPYLREAGFTGDVISPEEQARIGLMVEAVKEHLAFVAQIVDHVQIFFADAVQPDNEEAAAVLAEEQVPTVLGVFRRILEETPVVDVATAKSLIKAVGKETKAGGRKLFMPIRVALTGRTHGPELDYVIAILGVSGCLRRLNRVLSGV